MNGSGERATGSEGSSWPQPWNGLGYLSRGSQLRLGWEEKKVDPGLSQTTQQFREVPVDQMSPPSSSLYTPRMQYWGNLKGGRT